MVLHTSLTAKPACEKPFKNSNRIASTRIDDHQPRQQPCITSAWYVNVSVSVPLLAVVAAQRTPRAARSAGERERLRGAAVRTEEAERGCGRTEIAAADERRAGDNRSE